MAGVRHLVDDVAGGRLGEVVSVSLHLGHGGRPGDESTWKLDPARAGGGALLDPGIHLLDLALLLAGGPVVVAAAIGYRGFWRTGVEEECHVLMRAGGAIVNAQASVVRWRSTFAVAAHGTDGYGIVSGRGRNYGPQTYVRGPRWGWLDRPSQAASEELVVTTDCEDVLATEIAAALGEPPETCAPLADHTAALAALRLYDQARAFLDG
jgi:predicted dehydrogenase